MRSHKLNWAFAGLGLLLIGCSGGGKSGDAGSGGSCVAVSPCGGNIVGTWKITTSCVTATKDLSSVCAGASGSIVYTYSGMVTYNADGTSSLSVSATIANHEHYPSGCTPFGLTCDQLGQGAKDAGVSSNCSTDATGACICDSTEPVSATNDPGTYTTSGGTLTTTYQSGSVATALYCVQGNVLYEMVVPADGGQAATGGIVFSKQ